MLSEVRLVWLRIGGLAQSMYQSFRTCGWALYGIGNCGVTLRLASLYSTRMTDNRKAGIALTVGSIGGAVTMAVHPAGAGKVTPDYLGHLVWIQH